ncbi:acyltransferase [Shewanella sp. WXL01]|nr:acyltransferase [Shewanella sp. WXL01]
MTLAQYVKKRNGVALGAKGSLSNMLRNALGAISFHHFWLYWNPIWGYYLGRYVMQPASKLMPQGLATVTTFVVSGLLHDVAISLIKMQLVLVLTPWFGVMGVVAYISKHYKFSLAHWPWIVRAVVNVSIIVACYLVARQGAVLIS